MESEKQHLIHVLSEKYPGSIFLSAYKGINLNSLFDKLLSIISQEFVETQINIPVGIQMLIKLLISFMKKLIS
jgi:50S ribosomal subunit-associated GTPase HflX